MDRQELIRTMRQSVDGASFINHQQLCRFLGIANRERVKKAYLIGLPKVGRMYFIPDVAGRIIEKSQEDME